MVLKRWKNLKIKKAHFPKNNLSLTVCQKDLFLSVLGLWMIKKNERKQYKIWYNFLSWIQEKKKEKEKNKFRNPVCMQVNSS